MARYRQTPGQDQRRLINYHGNAFLGGVPNGEFDALTGQDGSPKKPSDAPEDRLVTSEPNDKPMANDQGPAPQAETRPVTCYYLCSPDRI